MAARSVQTPALFAILLLALPLAQAAPEQETGDRSQGRPTILRPIIIVPAGRASATQTADPGGSTTVIPARSSWRGYRGLPEILSNRAGIRLHRLGGREDMASVVVRGAAAGRVKVMIDGLALTRADQSTVNLADIPIDNIDRIEIYKGFTPSNFAAAGAESSVNIITRKDGGEPRMALSLGSFGTRRIYAAGGGVVGGGQLAASIGVRRTRGDFRYTDDNGTESFTGDDSRRRRENNDYRSLDLLATWRREAADGSRLMLSENLFHKDEGLPGLGSNESSRARLRMTRNIASLGWESAGGGRRVEVGLTYRRDRLSDPKSATEGVAGIGLPYDLETDTTVAADANGHWRKTLGPTHLLDIGVALAFERFRARYPGSTTSGSGPQQRLRGSVVLADELHLPGPGIDLIGQLRHETLWNRFDGQALLPVVEKGDLPSSRDRSTDARISLHWQARPSLSLRANLATYFRPPSFSELFGNDGFSVANPELGPETGTARDIGLVAELDPKGPAVSRLRLEYSWFDNDTDDMIVFVQTGARVAKPLNIGRARSRGHEVDLRLDLDHGAGLSLAYTEQRATNLSPFPDYRGKQLPARPRHELHSTVAVALAPWEAAWTLTYRDGFFLDQANNPVRRVPAHWTHGLRVASGANRFGLHVVLELDNIGNEQYADEYGFPVPGRALYLTLSTGPRT